jgi:hypothetical protein
MLIMPKENPVLSLVKILMKEIVTLRKKIDTSHRQESRPNNDENVQNMLTPNAS